VKKRSNSQSSAKNKTDHGKLMNANKFELSWLDEKITQLIRKNNKPNRTIDTYYFIKARV
jgi:hypothetical protein